MSHLPAKRSFGDSVTTLAKQGVAIAILAIGAIILLKFAIGVAIGFVMSILTLLLVIGAIVGVIWALRKL